MDKESKFKITGKRPFASEGEQPEEHKPTERNQHMTSEKQEFNANFAQLFRAFCHQAIQAMGLLEGKGGETSTQIPNIDLHSTGYSIDMLNVLKEKTRNNLSATEDKILTDFLYELRMAFVDVSKGTHGLVT